MKFHCRQNPDEYKAKLDQLKAAKTEAMEARRKELTEKPKEKSKTSPAPGLGAKWPPEVNLFESLF